MDRPIDPSFKRRQLIRRILFAVLGSVLVVGVLVWLTGWIRPSVARSRIRTATVDIGPIEATITASGTVVPESEQVISTPIDARIIKILKRPGAVLSRGQPILQLDISASLLALERLNEELALKENQRVRLKLDLEKTVNDLQSRWQLQNLNLQSRRERLEPDHKLHELGALSGDQLRQSELEAEKAGIELKAIENSLRITRQSTQAQLDGLSLEMKILRREIAEAKRQMELASTQTDRDGVLTWVTPEEGATIYKGQAIARMADLSSFCVKATVSDIHATRLAIDLPVRVKVNDDHYLQGHITRIQPTIENGVVNLEIGLENKSSPLLRSNLQVDAYIVTARKNNVFRIKKGPFINGGEGVHDVFVIRDGVALKTPVHIGISSFESYEVAEGLVQGDEVIISDMRDYEHLQKVKVK